MKYAGTIVSLLLASTALAAAPAYAERGGHAGPRAVGHERHAQAHERANYGQARAHQAHEQARDRAQERMHMAENDRRAHPRRDRDNNPPGMRGGPGTNWENPPGPKGGPGVSPDRRRFDRDNNPPGRAGGPGTNWENPPGPAGGPGASPDRRVPPRMRDPGVNARQEFQRDRIGQGVRSGELTKSEAKELTAEQRAIRKEEREYKSDGKLTKEERKDLHQDLNAASKNIYEQKHDAEKR